MKAAISSDDGHGVLLDAAASMQRARALRSWSQERRTELASRFAALIGAWSGEWLPAPSDLAASARVDVMEPDGVWRLGAVERACWAFEPSRRAGGSRGALAGLEGASATHTDPALPAMRALAERMFAADTNPVLASGISPSQGARGATVMDSPGLAAALARAAWSDWLQRLDVFLGDLPLQAFADVDRVGATSAAQAWSGALCIRASWCGGEWTLALPWDAVTAVLGEEAPASQSRNSTPQAGGQPKVRLDLALADRRVALRVMLEGAQLNLGQIQGLRVGDVIPLAHRLDAAAQVVGADSQRVCDGWLGQSQGRLAIELAAVPSSGSSSHPAASSGKAAPTVSFAGAAHNTPSSKGSFK
ncbi:FliM/FliN family flagellar motor C-terminal domain-containing protein [Acidovorax cavernicola]|uniref:FliM/FliN family flagellar motor switch protein n=1 Tax=Acidovorax cavernicola TaxID=1675792 RepID=A0A9X8GUU6_9BURK|nr:FliM/FliN family flagellar motor C-terminal domain-containing protein [Acidovorax cavernicola]RIX79087.1 FliM/FliN family flagellar motor switch protein [Acidovorax cavernicola]